MSENTTLDTSLDDNLADEALDRSGGEVELFLFRLWRIARSQPWRSMQVPG